MEIEMCSCLLQDIPCGRGNHSDRKVGLVVEKVIDQEVNKCQIRKLNVKVMI